MPNSPDRIVAPSVVRLKVRIAVGRALTCGKTKRRLFRLLALSPLLPYSGETDAFGEWPDAVLAPSSSPIRPSRGPTERRPWPLVRVSLLPPHQGSPPTPPGSPLIKLHRQGSGASSGSAALRTDSDNDSLLDGYRELSPAPLNNVTAGQR